MEVYLCSLQYLHLFSESSFQILDFLIHFIQLCVFTSFAITQALVSIFLKFIELFKYSLNSLKFLMKFDGLCLFILFDVLEFI